MKLLLKSSVMSLFFGTLLIAQPSIDIPAIATTTPTGNDVDDCAIWVHPSDPAKSAVIINDKGPLSSTGGLYVYDLDGQLLQKVPVFKPQNPDIRYNVVFGRDTMDVLVCADRELGGTEYNKIRVFRINAAKIGATTGFLAEITSSAGIPTGQNEAYGHSLYLRPTDGALFSIVSPNSTGSFTQIRLESDGTGKIKGSIVRTWGVDDIMGDLCEGICCDDELGFIYIADEDFRVLKYQADPDKKTNSLVGVFALNDGIQGDREGINIYRCADNTGFIVLSSQGNNTIKIYDRITNAFRGTVSPEGMKDCDGLDITAIPMGTSFPCGMAAFHLGSSAGSQFSFYDWADIATGLKLSPPCEAPRPARSPDNLSSFSTNMLPKKQLMPACRFHRRAIDVSNLSSTTTTVTIGLFDLHGRVAGTFSVSSIRNGAVHIPLNAKAVHPGTYIVKIRSGNESFSTSLVAIQ